MSNEWRYQQYDQDNKTIKNYYINNYHPWRKKDDNPIYAIIFFGILYGLYRLTLFLWEQLLLLKQKIEALRANHPITTSIAVTLVTMLFLYTLFRLIKRRKKSW